MRLPAALPLVTTILAAVLAAAAVPLPASGVGPPGAPGMSLMTPAAGRAARTDRRPVAGGVYDPAVQKTFITWGGQHEDNFIQAYDHASGTWSAPVRVGDGGDDSHNYPTIVQAPDGHLLVFRGIHNTELVVARSPAPHAIDGAWTEQVIAEGNGATYPMPFTTKDGTIFVFIRETAHDLDRSQPVDTRPMKYVRSVDSGLTWQNSAQLTGQKWVIAPTDRADHLNEIYIGQLRYDPGGLGRPERVHIVYTLAGGGPEGNLHDRYHHNIYYTWFSPGDLHFHAANGRDLGVRIDDAAQEAYLKVADTPLLAAPFQRSPDYIQLVGAVTDRQPFPAIPSRVPFPAELRPFVVWMELDPSGALHDRVGLFTGDGWQVRELGTGVRVRDMEQVVPRVWRVYAVVEGAPSDIVTYLLRPDTGWQYESTIATPTAVQRIEVIGRYRDPARILATGASSGRDVSIADGDVYVAGAATG